MYFSNRDLVFIALASASAFVIVFLLSTGIIAATGIPMTGGVVIALVANFLLALYLSILKKPGTATLILLIYTILSIPTLILGPPGIYKPIIGIVIGVLVDLILYLGSYRKYYYYISLGVSFPLFAPLVLFFMILLGLPGAEKVSSLLFILMGIYLVEALIGTWLGLYVYRKVRNKRSIRQFEN